MKFDISPTDFQGLPKLHKELWVFFIAIGLLLAVAAYFSLSPVGAPPLWGFPRHLALGVPIAATSALHIICGGVFAVNGSRMSCIGGALASTFLAAFYFFFILSAGILPIDVMGLIVVSIPVLVWSRAGKYLAETAAKHSR